MDYFTKNKVLEFIKTSLKPATKRDIARAFGIKGSDRRVALKQILKQLEKEGAISKTSSGEYSIPFGLPSVGMLEVNLISIDGDVFAKPLDWNIGVQGEIPRIEVMPDQKNFRHLHEGSRFLARIERSEENLYSARIIRMADVQQNTVLGILKILKGGAILEPTHKKAKYDFEISSHELNGALNGDLVLGEILPARGIKRKKAKIIKVLGKRDDVKAISLISLHEAGLREHFPEHIVAESANMSVPSLGDREDLRDIPLITIDGADARDFDDAVFAEKIDDGIFHLIVAIADVAFYVRHGTLLDTEAQRRGNSTYFPDRVVPMLPEILSNDLCSLRPNEPRATLAVHMWIDTSGNLLRYKFVRGLMKSVARLTYEQVQVIHDGCAEVDENIKLKQVIHSLYEVYFVLDKARKVRGALDLDLPERQILIDASGNMIGVKPRTRLDSHKLIEEFMILANVAAARALEGRRDFPCVYRVHEQPSFEKLESAREFIESFGLSLPKGQVVKPAQINTILSAASQLPYSHLISQMILRTQSQAHYSTINAGHFGLALEHYAHFTSPIRRYSDLLVHRALISAFHLGPGGMVEEEKVRLEQICQDISATERISMEAERNAVDRFTASYLASHINAQFEGRISGVTRFGLFVELTDTGASGIIPVRSLDDDYYIHDERAHALIGRRHKKVFRLGAPVTVSVVEADAMTGGTVFSLIGAKGGADIPGLRKPRIPADGGKRPGYRKSGKKSANPNSTAEKRRFNKPKNRKP